MDENKSVYPETVFLQAEDVFGFLATDPKDIEAFGVYREIDDLTDLPGDIVAVYRFEELRKVIRIISLEDPD